MVQYTHDGLDRFGTIEEVTETSYMVREYARAGEDFLPTDNVHEVTEARDMIDYAAEEMEKSMVPVQTKSIEVGDFVKWETEEGETVNALVEAIDETTISAQVIEADGVKSGVVIDVDAEQVETIEPIEVIEKKSDAPKLVAKIKSAETKEAENEDGEKIGVIEGYLSIFNNTDLGGDVVRKGAFTQTINHNNGRFKLLLDHGYHTRDVAGMFYGEEDEKGLKIRAEMPLSVGYVKDAYEIIKFNLSRGVALGLSIGYDIVKSAPNSSGGYDLTELKLYEGSVTPFPMNTAALIDNAKANKELYKPKSKASDDTSRNQDAKALEAYLNQTIETIKQELKNG